MYTETTDLQISSNIANLADEVEVSASDAKRQNEILIQHILLSMHMQATALSKESISETVCSSSTTAISPDLASSSSLTSSSPASGLSSAKGTSSRGSVGAYGLPTVGSSAANYPFTGDPKKDYQTFIKILSDKRTNFTSMSKAEEILNFLIQFSETYKNDPAVNSAEMKQMITTYMQIIIATAYINGQDVQAAINRIESKFAGAQSPAMKAAIAEFNQAGKNTVQFYIDNYSVTNPADPTKKIPMSKDTFARVGGGQMAFCAINSIGKISHMLYKSLIAEVMKDAAAATMKGHKNIQLIYLELLNIIRSKEGDAEDEIAGTANMLKQLGLGETSTGAAEDAISKLISLTKSLDPSIDLKTINTNLTALAKFFHDYKNWDRTQVARKLHDAGVKSGDEINAFLDLHDTLLDVQISQPMPLDWTKIPPYTQSKILNELEIINRNPKAWTAFNLKPEDAENLVKAIDSYNGFTPDVLDTAKQLAQALLDLREMGLYFNDSIFPGLKEITEELLGDEKGAGGDFFAITKLDLNTLQLAANGNEAAQEKVVKAIEALKPESATSETSPLSTITNEINHIATFFNDRNNEEQADAQFLSSNDEKILAFIKEMQDFPVNFEKAILQNLQRSGQ